MSQHGGEQSGLVTLTFDLLTLKVVFESRVTCATSMPMLVFLGFSVLDLGPMYATDRRQTKASRNAPSLLGAGYNKRCLHEKYSIAKTENRIVKLLLHYNATTELNWAALDTRQVFV